MLCGPLACRPGAGLSYTIAVGLELREDTVYLAPRGTIDILPEDQPYWAYVYADRVAEVTGLYGYERIDVPI